MMLGADRDAACCDCSLLPWTMLELFWGGCGLAVCRFGVEGSWSFAGTRFVATPVIGSFLSSGSLSSEPVDFLV